jgi:chloramphenicol 3-O phosphotransferase
MVNAGGRIVYDDVFLNGAASQQRLRAHLDGVNVLWVGVRCLAATAAGRELARGDRAPGMAAAQAELVHEDVTYDLEVNTTNTESLDCAHLIAARVGEADQGRRG